MADNSTPPNPIDPRSGFCKSNSTFYSKRKPIPLPSNESLDVTTFISSQPHHGRIAFIDASSGRRLTFSDVWSAVDSVSSALSAMGVRKGHVVLLLSPSSIFFPVVCLSVISLGAVITTANPMEAAPDIAHQIADSKPVLAFATPQLVPKIAASNLPIVLIGEEKLIGTAKIVTTLEEMMKKKPSERQLKERVTQNDTATILYTSGTTSGRKGVMTSHKSLIVLVQTDLSRFGSGGGNRVFGCIVQMFNAYGLVAFALGPLASGYTVVVLSASEMDELFLSIEKYKVTDLPLPVQMLGVMVNEADQIRRKYDFGSLKSVLCGGPPWSRARIEGFVEKYPKVEVLQAYGLIESTGMGASTVSLEESRRYGTVGMLSPNFEAKIVDPDSGEALQVNRIGELWLRGPTVMKGYFRATEATASTLDSAGWLRTGDLCYIDEDGFIFVVERWTVLIKYKGYQVPPAELEDLLLTHPEIADAVVIPFPDRDVGQYPMAYVVRKSGSNLSESAVMDFVAKQVAPYKRIRRVSFIASVPKSALGRILRKDLIKLATSKL